MGSTRLPGKCLLDLGGKPLLAHTLDRLARAPVDVRIVATPEGPRDEPIRALARARGWETFEGSEEDVLERFARAAAAHRLDVVVRATGDNPFLDPEAVAPLVAVLTTPSLPTGGLVRYARTSGWPNGCGIEAVRAEDLAEADREARDPREREHVMPYFYLRPEKFRIAEAPAPSDRLAPHLSLTVDEEADLRLVREIVRRLGPDAPLPAIVGLLEAEPALAKMNEGVGRKGLSVA